MGANKDAGIMISTGPKILRELQGTIESTWEFLKMSDGVIFESKKDFEKREYSEQISLNTIAFNKLMKLLEFARKVGSQGINAQIAELAMRLVNTSDIKLERIEEILSEQGNLKKASAEKNSKPAPKKIEVEHTKVAKKGDPKPTPKKKEETKEEVVDEPAKQDKVAPKEEEPKPKEDVISDSFDNGMDFF